MKRIYLRQIGNSHGVLIPKPLLARAGFSMDTMLDLIATLGEIRLVPAGGVAVVLSPDEIDALLSGDLSSANGVSAVHKLKACKS
jgi:hypothetical protein